MKTSFRRPTCARIHVTSRAGITLVEVLVAIFIIGIGLLELLALFPLGALDLVQTIKDDRAATIAAQAEDLSEQGQKLLGQTGDFLETALAGNVDRQQAAALKAGFEDLADAAAIIKLQLLDLRPSVPRRVRPKIEVLLSQIRAIGRGMRSMSVLLGILAEGGTSPNP